MTHLLAATAFLAFTLTASAFDHGHAAFDRLLNQHVSSEGLVDYAALNRDRPVLQGYLKELGNVSRGEFGSWDKAQRLAFLINLYNAVTLDVVLEHRPLKSIKDINGGAGPWDEKIVPLLGRSVSLDTLENEVIRPDFREPRIHFALVCAAMGCPPLRNGAFTAAGLNEQLDEQTETFLDQSAKNRNENGTLHLSPIFDWYGKDFPGGPAKWVELWLGKSSQLKYTDYDWSLNQS